MTFMSRRRTLGVCLWAGLFGPGVVAADGPSRQTSTGAGIERAIQTLPAFPEASAAGGVIRSVVGIAPDCDAVVERLRRDYRYAGPSSPGRFTEWASRRCEADYLAGRTMRVRGWLLSETEVAVCCVASDIAGTAAARGENR